MIALQSVTPAAWVGPTMAVSLAVIALAFIVIALASAVAVREAALEMRRLARTIETLRADLAPALGAVRAVSGEGQRLATLIGDEAEEVVRSSRKLREGIRQRVADLEAIYEVLHEEVEETAIEVAVTLRSLRSGAGWFSRLRWLLGGRRRR